MLDDTQKNIDLDALVDTLLRERQESVPVAEPEKPEKPGKPVATVTPSHTEEPEETLPPVRCPAEEPVKAAVAVKEPEETLPESTGLVMTAERPKSPQKRKPLRELFRRKGGVDPAEDEDWEDWDLKPIGHYRDEEASAPVVLVEPALEPEPEPEESATPALSPEEFPPIQAVAETITMPVVLPSGLAATRVISTANKPAQPTPEPEPPADDQLPDQLSLEEMVRVEDIDPAAPEEPMDDPEELLQRARQERIRDFAFNGDEEEANEPDEEAAPETVEPMLEDFTAYEHTKAVQAELQYRTRTALFGFLVTAVLELVLLVLTLLTSVAGGSPITGMGYLTVHLFALGLMMAINHRVMSDGLSGLFTLQANGDTPAALASSVALLGVILHFVDSSQPLPYWAPVAGLLLTLCSAGQFAQAVCIRRNFAFVAYPGKKYAASLIADENARREIGRRAVGDGEADVVYFRPTAFLSDYLTNAYEKDRCDGWCRWAVPAGACLSLVLSGIFVLTGHVEGFWDWLGLFTGLLCLSMQVSRLAVQLPMNQCSRYMLSRGGFIVGWQAVRQFGSPDGLVVDIADLYPDESMLLHGIKTFAGAHIDDAILDAASLSVRSGGPLAMIFRRIIQNKEDLLHEVDSLVYEQGMGLSGWVDGRRVLVGNRRLLQNHGVDVPSLDYEARYAKDGRRLVYLSTAGELSAMFVVSYLADPDIEAALQELCRAKVTLLVRSCDPNISNEDLCEAFDLDPYYVDILPAAAGRQYMQLVQEESEQTSAVMASNGHILGTARLMSVCRHLHSKTTVALVIQALASALGLLFCVVWMLNNTLSLFQPLMLVLVTALLSWLIPLFRRT